MSDNPPAAAASARIVTLEVLGQAVAIPVEHVRDVVGPQR